MATDGFICGTGAEIPVDLPDAGEGYCCYGAVMGGPQDCTCWEPIHDLEQQEPKAGPLNVQPRPCGDCAFLKGSPERSGDERAGQDWGTLERSAREGRPFYCHAGMRWRASWAHPSGVVVAGLEGDYDPPIAGGIPRKADGSPADLCGGWWARRRHWLRLAAGTEESKTPASTLPHVDAGLDLGASPRSSTQETPGGGIPPSTPSGASPLPGFPEPGRDARPSRNPVRGGRAQTPSLPGVAAGEGRGQVEPPRQRLAPVSPAVPGATRTSAPGATRPSPGPGPAPVAVAGDGRATDGPGRRTDTPAGDRDPAGDDAPDAASLAGQQEGLRGKDFRDAVKRAQAELAKQQRNQRARPWASRRQPGSGNGPGMIRRQPPDGAA